jgi:hypothetical protein
VPHRLRTGPRAWFRQESFRDLSPGGKLASSAVRATRLPGSPPSCGFTSRRSTWPSCSSSGGITSCRCSR